MKIGAERLYFSYGYRGYHIYARTINDILKAKNTSVKVAYTIIEYTIHNPVSVHTHKTVCFPRQINSDMKQIANFLVQMSELNEGTMVHEFNSTSVKQT